MKKEDSDKAIEKIIKDYEKKSKERDKRFNEAYKEAKRLLFCL
jgi:hypothetical protein